MGGLSAATGRVEMVGQCEPVGEDGARGCPRVTEGFPGGKECDCPALSAVCAEEGSEEHLPECVEALLGCRAFLWDVLMDGGWTGCARTRLKALTALYGPERVGEAFEG